MQHLPIKIPANNRQRLAKSLGVLACGLLLCVAIAFSVISFAQPPAPKPPYAIALDAGHGGSDLGAVGILHEVTVNEKTVEYLYLLLDADPNFKPILCRNYGEASTLTQRTRKANALGAVMLLSVHANADPFSAETSGFECYPTPPGRKWHEQSFRFAGLLAAEMALAGSTLRGEGGIRYVYYEKQEDGSTQKVFREASDTAKYTAQSFTVVEQPNCPAVLVEQCFVTSQADVDAFGTEAGCRLAAQSYYKAICAYWGTTPVLAPATL